MALCNQRGKMASKLMKLIIFNQFGKNIPVAPLPFLISSKKDVKKSFCTFLIIVVVVALLLLPLPRVFEMQTFSISRSELLSSLPKVSTIWQNDLRIPICKYLYMFVYLFVRVCLGIRITKQGDYI